MQSLAVQYIKTSSIKESKYNPRIISEEQMSGLKASIEKFGFVDPVIVNKRNMTIVGGHQRTKAAVSLGFDEVPCVFVDLNDTEEKALNITLNSQKISGDYTDSLQDLLQEIKFELPEYEDLNLNMLELKIESTPIDNDKPEIIDEDKFLIVIECKDESEQSDLFEEFNLRELSCKLMS